MSNRLTGNIRRLPLSRKLVLVFALSVPCVLLVTMQLIQSRQPHFVAAKESIISATFAPRKSQLAVLVRTGKKGKSYTGVGLQMWDATRRQLQWSVDAKGCDQIVFSHDGMRLAGEEPPTCSCDGQAVTQQSSKIRIWDANTGATLRTIKMPGHGDIYAKQLVFLPDNRTLVVNGWREESIDLNGEQGQSLVLIFLDTSTGKQIRTMVRRAQDLRLSPDGKSIALCVFDAKKHRYGTYKCDMMGHHLHFLKDAAGAFYFSPDGRWFAIAPQFLTDGPYMTVYDWKNGCPVYLLSPPASERFVTDNGVIFSRDGARMYAASDATIPTDDGPSLNASKSSHVIMYDAVSGRKMRTFVPITRGYSAISLSSDETVMAIVHESGIELRPMKP